MYQAMHQFVQPHSVHDGFRDEATQCQVPFGLPANALLAHHI